MLGVGRFSFRQQILNLIFIACKVFGGTRWFRRACSFLNPSSCRHWTSPSILDQHENPCSAFSLAHAQVRCTSLTCSCPSTNLISQLLIHEKPPLLCNGRPNLFTAQCWKRALWRKSGGDPGNQTRREDGEARRIKTVGVAKNVVIHPTWLGERSQWSATPRSSFECQADCVSHATAVGVLSPFLFTLCTQSVIMIGGMSVCGR